MVGSILFVFLFLLSFVGFVGRIQSALLFNIKFAKSLKRGRLLVGLVFTPNLVAHMSLTLLRRACCMLRSSIQGISDVIFQVRATVMTTSSGFA